MRDILNALQEQVDACTSDDCEMCHRHREILAKHTPAPETHVEPVAWRVLGADGKWHSSTNKDIALHWEASGFESVPLYAHPPAPTPKEE